MMSVWRSMGLGVTVTCHIGRDLSVENFLQLASGNVPREIPRPAGEGAGLRDDTVQELVRQKAKPHPKRRRQHATFSDGAPVDQLLLMALQFSDGDSA